MNLKQAVAEIEGAFGPPNKTNPPPDKAIVTSGGVKANARDPEIALYISKEHAIEAWVREVSNFLDGKAFKAYQFVGDINVDTWAMTTTDLHNQQRIAEPRYSVSATIGVEWGPIYQVVDEEESATRWEHRGACSNQNVLSPNPHVNAKGCPCCGGYEVKIAEDSANPIDVLMAIPRI